MDEIHSKMMVSGRVHLAGTNCPPIEVRRCMPVLSCDGRKLGMVAAVYLDPQTQEITAVLLGSLPIAARYRLIPINVINRVSEDSLYLHITAESAEKLEPYQTE